MKTNFPERIIEMLRGSSNGLTSKDIAERLGTTAGNISSRLSKLAAYGVIGKARGSSAIVRAEPCIKRHLSDAAMQIDDRRTPAEILATGPELCIPTAAAQTRIVSVARIRMDSRKSVRLFSGIICDDISEFESSHASQAVGSL